MKIFNRSVIVGIILHYFYHWRHSLDRIGDSFYWPAMNLLIWGLMSVYIKNQSRNIPEIVLILLTGVIFWLVIWRSEHEISLNLLEEFWNKNLINIFASPMRIREWVVSVMALSIVKMLITLLFSAILAYVLYKYNIFMYGFSLIPFVVSLTLTGWFLGFFVSAIVIRFGQKIQTLAWTTPMLLAPFSAIYYPLSTLPDWAQTVGQLIPSTYIFEGMREIIFTGNVSYEKLFISFALNIIYLILSIWFFVFMFNQSRKLGLGRLV